MNEINLNNQSYFNQEPLPDVFLPIIGENTIPHWERSDVVYHVCFRLADSVPASQLKQWRNERERIQSQAFLEHRLLTPEEEKTLQFLYSDKIARFLDAGHGECILKNAAIAQIVRDSLVYFQDQRYKLHCWCIMPNHVHVAFNALAPYKMSRILHGWKSYTAHEINKTLHRKGSVWQKDYYNHIIRTNEEYCYQIRYIWNNPEKSYLRNWPWRWKKELTVIL